MSERVGSKNKILTSTAAGIAFLAVSGCSEEAPNNYPEPGPTVTVTETVTAEPVPTEELLPSNAFEMTDDQLQETNRIARESVVSVIDDIQAKLADDERATSLASPDGDFQVDYYLSYDVEGDHLIKLHTATTYDFILSRVLMTLTPLLPFMTPTRRVLTNLTMLRS